MNDKMLEYVKSQIVKVNAQIGELNDNVYRAGHLHGQLNSLNKILEMHLRIAKEGE